MSVVSKRWETRRPSWTWTDARFLVSVPLCSRLALDPKVSVLFAAFSTLDAERERPRDSGAPGGADAERGT